MILKDLDKMLIDDAHDDTLVAEETTLHAHTRAQTRAADAAKVLDDPIILTTSSDDQTENLLTNSPRRCRSPKSNPPPPCSFATTTDKIALSDDLANHNELAIARAFLRQSVEFILPPHYRPDVMGEMRVIGVDVKKLTRPTQF